MASLKKIAISGLFWTFTERFSVQGIQFVISVILARLLLPEDFGMIGMILVFVSIGTTLRDSGMTNSLIRSLNPTETDYSTVFFINFASSVLIYLLFFITAPWIAGFYKMELLTDLVRVQSLTILIGSFSSIQYARLTKSMNFKKQLAIQLPSMLLGGGLGIGMAFFGYGVWSLVWMNVFQSSAASVQYWFLTKWRPQFIFSKAKMKEHFNFGYKLTLSSLLDSIYNNFLYMIIGKFFSAAQLGFYTRANSTKNLPLNNISSALFKVTYPLFSKIQEDTLRLKALYRKLMQQVLFWVIPSLLSIAVIAEPLFRVLFTEKWVPAASYFQILCAVGALYPLNSYNLSILNVKGRSDLYLKVQVINKVYTVLLTLAMLPLGIYAMLFMQILISVLNFIVNTYYAGKLIDYPIGEQLKDVAPIFLIGLIMLGACFGVDYLLLEFLDYDLARVCVVPLLGFTIYFFLAKLMKLPSMAELEETFGSRKKHLVANSLKKKDSMTLFV